MSTVIRFTPDDLLVMPDGKGYELVDGELVEKHVSRLTSYIGGELFAFLREFVRANELGFVFTSDCGYRCFPHDTGQVRKPDVSFISAERASASEIVEGWWPIAPDLAVEIVSPNDVASELQKKIKDYKLAEIPVIWVIYPETETAIVYRAEETVWLEPPIELVGEGPLDGFRCTLDELFPGTSDDSH